MGELASSFAIDIKFSRLQTFRSVLVSSSLSESSEEIISIRSNHPFLFLANRVKSSKEQPIIGLTPSFIHAL